MTGDRRKKLSAGCWTCRLRRKRCDNIQPCCTSCAELEIQCYASVTRPAWMDGGPKQKEMTTLIKAQVKNGSNGRRERKLARKGQSKDSAAFIITSQGDFTGKAGGDEHGQQAQPGLRSSREENTDTKHGPHGLRSLDSLTSGASTTPAENMSVASSFVQFASLGLAWEQDFIMIYLDYVFPFLFPYYRPPLVATSRSWLLSFIEQNKIIRHCVLSMSSFFFTVGIKDTRDAAHAPCNWTVWRDVVKHADRAFAMIQQDMLARGDARSLGLLEKIHVIETITQLLVFDTFVGSTAGWMMHLKPALSLITEVLEDYDAGNISQPGLSGILQSPEWEASISECNVPPGRRRLWTPAQSSLRFFTALLITVDILASTAVSHAPSLQSFHSTVLADVAPEQISVGLDLHSFVGCHNWTLIAIGKVAALDAWKKEMQATGKDCQTELVRRGDRIFDDLAEGLRKLDIENSKERSDQDLVRFQMFYTGFQPGQKGCDTCTKLWAYSARIYLNIVLYGWNPSLDLIKQDATKVRDTLRTVTSVAKLRSVAWPACVVGCVTQSKSEREALASFLRDMGNKLLLRSIFQALDTMEAVWDKGDSLDRETWDLAACLGILGAPALLF